MTRRHALLLAAPALQAQRLTPVEELVNTFEMEQMAQRKLPADLFKEIAGSNRTAFDRITFRPRMMVNTLELDLTTEIFGERHFAPILVAPLANPSRYHPDGETAIQQGAAAAKTTVIGPPNATTPWVQVAAAIPPTAKVLFLTAPFEEAAFKRLRASTKLPIVVKGILTPASAKQAIDNGANGIVISNYRSPQTASIEVLPAIAAEVNNKVPLLIDGSFRRGSDILKALALGAKAVLIGRPVLWGLAAYGARGVQQVLEQLQSELARDMAMCGLRTCAQATPQYVKIHRR
jgi:isopentenyl diphosphate isomerase/L-lactate dehydrogenase-like FMN-dependent dehydrogenase